MRDTRLIAVRTIAGMLCWAASALFGPPLKAQEFPVILNSQSKLRQLGIAVGFGTNVPPLKNKCYYYGDGGYLISTSDKFYDRFKQRGFSIEAMCLGLISETHYDPESGRRLPTYILVDRARMKSGEPGAVSDELPLDLPDCFKNANPYSDCRFRFGRVTGKTLTAAETDAYKRLGAAIHGAMRLKLTEMAGTQEFFGGQSDEELIQGFRKANGYFLSSDVNGAIPEDLLHYSSASVWVRLTKLAWGYGYALDADGTAAPNANPAALRAANAGLLKPQIDPQRLRQILNSNR